MCASQELLRAPGVEVSKPVLEKLTPRSGESFRCFNRRSLQSPAKWHHHPEFELTYVERGSGCRLVGDHIGTYADNDLVLLGPELPHTWLSDAYRGERFDRHPAVVVQFQHSFLGERFFEAKELEAVSALLHRAQRGLWFPPRVGARLGKPLTEMINMPPARKLIALLSCLERLSQALPQSRELASCAYTTPSTYTSSDRLLDAFNYIDVHLSEPTLSQASLANLVDMNPSAFTRAFKRATGRTVSAYIAELRVGLACRLLAETSKSILDISLQSGFASLSSFNRRFRDLRDTTPQEFRRIAKRAIK